MPAYILWKSVVVQQKLPYFVCSVCVCIEGAVDEFYSLCSAVSQFDNIIKGLQSFNSENWQEGRGSIWDWDDEEFPYSEKIKSETKAPEAAEYVKEQRWVQHTHRGLRQPVGMRGVIVF